MRGFLLIYSSLFSDIFTYLVSRISHLLLIVLALFFKTLQCFDFWIWTLESDCNRMFRRCSVKLSFQMPFMDQWLFTGLFMPQSSLLAYLKEIYHRYDYYKKDCNASKKNPLHPIRLWTIQIIRWQCLRVQRKKEFHVSSYGKKGKN